MVINLMASLSSKKIILHSALPKNKNIEKNLLTLFLLMYFLVMEEMFGVYHLVADDDSWIIE